MDAITDEFKYGIIAYASNNIGDEVQSIAQMRFLPRVDYYIARDKIKQFKPDTPDEKVKLIMNAWWMQQMHNFPPPDTVIPLPISMHIRREICQKQFLEKNNVYKWFIKNSPIGCRDTATEERLASAGIPAYFSGCLTITLVGDKSLKNKGEKYILCVNLTEEELSVVHKRTIVPVRSFNKAFQGGSMEKRLCLAKSILYLIHNASCVITRNLHVALPCLAFNTPVLQFKVAPNPSGNYERFFGNDVLCNCLKPSEFIKDPDSYDINNPPQNPTTFHEMRDKLIYACSQFTGFDNNTPIFNSDFDPLWNLVNLLQMDKQQMYRNLYYVTDDYLYDAYINRKNKLMDKYYLIGDISKHMEVITDNQTSNK